MFMDTIRGLEKVFKRDIAPPKIVLVTGPPGSLKSSFVYTLLTKYVQNSNEFGLYATLEETTESHLKNMQSLGIQIPENLLISDYSDIRERFESKGSPPNILQMINGVIEYFKNEKGEKFTVFGLDSLNALYALINIEDLRVKMFHFFKNLRDKYLTSILILEIPELTRAAGGYVKTFGEGFLVDGLIRTGEIESQQDVMLYMQIKKMRSTRHSRKKHLMEIGESGISILGPVFS